MNDGGPAFPSVAKDVTRTDQEGMSLRDYFAGQVLVGLMAQSPSSWFSSTRSMTEAVFRSQDPTLVSKMAYGIADEMIAQRGKEVT